MVPVPFCILGAAGAGDDGSSVEEEVAGLLVDVVDWCGSCDDVSILPLLSAA